LPAEEPDDDVAGLHIVAAGLHYLSHADTAHHRVDIDRRHECPLMSHPDPAGRFHRQHERAD
jgi:hypothetical protein